MSNIIVKKSDRTQIVIKPNIFKGKKYVDVRNYFKSKEGEWLPTKKGISIPVEKYEETLDGLEKIADALAEEEQR